MRCEVGQGCWHHAYLDRVTTCGLDSNSQRVYETGARRSAIPADDDGMITRGYCSIPDGPPDLLNQRLGQGLPDDTADIVCLENFGWDLYEACVLKG